MNRKSTEPLKLVLEIRVPADKTHQDIAHMVMLAAASMVNMADMLPPPAPGVSMSIHGEHGSPIGGAHLQAIR